LTVGRFGSSRGDADGDVARFGCEKVAAAVPSMPAGRGRPAARGRNRDCARRGQGADAGRGYRNDAPGHHKDLLEPKLQGSPKALPRFRRPGERTPARGDQAPPPGKFTAASRIGAIPLYGSPPASGAGVTGFDSTNKKRRKNAAQTPTTPSGGTTTPAGGTQQSKPETTFTPVPTYAKPPSPKPAAARKPPPPEIHPVKAAARPRRDFAATL